MDGEEKKRQLVGLDGNIRFLGSAAETCFRDRLCACLLCYEGIHAAELHRSGGVNFDLAGICEVKGIKPFNVGPKPTAFTST